MRDLYNNVKVSRGASPVNETGTTAIVSQIIDMQGYSSLLFAILIGSLADSNATFAVLMEEGDASNLSDAAAVADEDMVGTEAAAGFQYDDDNEVRKIGYIGNKRYVRLTITPSGNSGDAYIGVVALQGHAAQKPVS